jgi:sulfocyanin
MTAQPSSGAAATTPATGAASPAGAGRTGAQTAAKTDSTTSGKAKGVKVVPNVATAVARAEQRPTTVTDSATKPETSAGPVRVNEFLTYDRGSRTVSLQLIAGYNGLNGSLNYNGATKGSHGIYVPTGWRIHVAVTNRDSDLQHSAIVVHEVLPPPVEPSEPAFPGAALPELDVGLHEDETGTMDFVASHAGRFMIACGVPGHAQAGMWLQLAVSNSIAVPSYR